MYKYKLYVMFFYYQSNKQKPYYNNKIEMLLESKIKIYKAYIYNIRNKEKAITKN